MIRQIFFSFWAFAIFGFFISYWINDGTFNSTDAKDLIKILLIHLGAFTFAIFVYFYIENSRKYYERQKRKLISRKLLCSGMAVSYFVGFIAYLVRGSEIWQKLK